MPILFNWCAGHGTILTGESPVMGNIAHVVKRKPKSETKG